MLENTQKLSEILRLLNNQSIRNMDQSWGILPLSVFLRRYEDSIQGDFWTRLERVGKFSGLRVSYCDFFINFAVNFNF